jgi:KAP family P-loop domain
MAEIRSNQPKDSESLGSFRERDFPDDQPSILFAPVADKVAERDHLGFTPYFVSLAQFLISPLTKPPLTVSIEGPWGSGKSSFMKLLKKEIERLSVTRPTIIEFNAWRHDKEDALWAAFALSFVKQLSSQLPFWNRLRGGIRLFWKRFSFESGLLDALRVLSISLILILAAVCVPVLLYTNGTGWAKNLAERLANYKEPGKMPAPDADKPLEKSASPTPTPGQTNSQQKPGFTAQGGEDSKANEPIYKFLMGTIRVGGVAGSGALYFYILYSVLRILGNPFEINLRKHLRSPDYEGRTAFIENFHRDFKRVLDAYIGKPKEADSSKARDLSKETNRLKTYVFVDDVDRCELPKAAELMNAINLLISDDPRLIFIIGMDRQKVAASVAWKYREIIPFLQSPGRARRNTANGLPSPIVDVPRVAPVSQSLRFGYAFLEKFIQIPFTLPAPRQEDLQKFLEEMSAPSGLSETNAPNGKAFNESVTPGNEKSTGGQEGGDKGGVNRTSTESTGTVSRKEWLLNQAVQRDSPFVSKITLWVAHTFNDNPRRLKQFINLFRLRLHIASNTGLLDKVDGKTAALTAEQLGKLTALQLRWPDFVEAWLADPNLLKSLQEAALSEAAADSDDPWFSDSELRALLRLDSKPGDVPSPTPAGVGLSPTVSLAEVSLDTVLRVAPIRVSTGRTGEAGSNLRQLAAEYENIRETLPSGNERTRAMAEKFREMQQTVARDGRLSGEAIGELFAGTPGDRIVALAAVYALQALGSAELVIDSIQNQRTAFEQYQALRCAELLLPQMNQQQRDGLISALKQSISKTIPPDDSTRWELANRLIANADKASSSEVREVDDDTRTESADRRQKPKRKSKSNIPA